MQRLDVLTPAQRAGVNDRARYRAPLSPEEASVLLAATYSLRAWREYDTLADCGSIAGR